MQIVKWLDRPHRLARDGSGSELDDIFFESSATQSFASDAARSDFRERWLGRYLRVYPEWVYVALSDEGALTGYLLGCLDDPAQTPLFSDLGYFQELAALTARFPGQLHVNLAAEARGAGVGGQLVSAFLRDARAAGCPGVHVVTGLGMRNVGFYERQRFRDQGHTTWNGSALVFLAQPL